MMLSPEEWSALLLSLRVSLWSVAIMLIPGIGCAWLLARKKFYSKALVDAIIHLPLVLPPVVVGYLLLLALGRRGWIGHWLYDNWGVEIAFTWRAAAIASAVMGFPLLVRAVRLAIELVDIRIEQAARTLGASPWRVFLTVTLPLSLPGILAGVILAIARSLGEFGATITFAGNIEGVTRTLPVAIFTYTQTPGGDPFAMRLVLISVVVSLAALIVSELLARRIQRRIGLAS
ncbi:MAG: molybdate ABC transporter permease subunit [Phycisphaerales bacterium]|nr:molybdate ABC transporter permease subunit [Phycisphaerales bacterium]MCI0629763.1 molybdate ABC transporter permease subunit [Phycisphaerales bacterium]MCI0676498.1 molybdate ABC transporter permease subunit [Phycisphaerales bacterium]